MSRSRLGVKALGLCVAVAGVMGCLPAVLRLKWGLNGRWGVKAEVNYRLW